MLDSSISINPEGTKLIGDTLVSTCDIFDDSIEALTPIYEYCPVSASTNHDGLSASVSEAVTAWKSLIEHDANSLQVIFDALTEQDQAIASDYLVQAYSMRDT